MRILVTGGAGFIGSNFIRYILSADNDCEIVNLDKLSYAGNLENLSDIEKDTRYKFVKGDICDKDIVNECLDGCEALINFAAESHVDRSIIDPTEFVTTNVVGTHVLLEAARRLNIKKFIQISTDEVYGSIDKGSFKEEDALSPNSPYSASKAGAEYLCRSYFVTFGLPVVITRSSNNFGPYQYPEKFVALAITNLIEGKKIPVYGDGKNVRDWIYVEDNCDAIYFVLKNGKAGDAYNIGGGREIENLEMVASILKLTGHPASMMEYVKDRPGHDRRYSLDDSRITQLGWKPKHTFDEALKKTVDWYKMNERWWRRIKEKSADYGAYYKKQYKETKD